MLPGLLLLQHSTPSLPPEVATEEAVTVAQEALEHQVEEPAKAHLWSVGELLAWVMMEVILKVAVEVYPHPEHPEELPVMEMVEQEFPLS
jgi:hypothetical protein